MNGTNPHVPSYTSASVYSSLAVFFIIFIPEELQRQIVISILLEVKSITPALGIVSYFLEAYDLQKPPVVQICSFFLTE